MTYVAYIDTTIGRLGIAERDQFLTHLFFGDEKTAKKAPTNSIAKWTPFLREAAREIKEYLAGKRREFEIPIKLTGTDFQLSVWDALRTIPYGQTRSYRDIAEQIGNVKACRAVGMANHWNPIAIVVPCHRVIGTNGSLTGFGGGLALKRQLLELEHTKESRHTGTTRVFCNSADR